MSHQTLRPESAIRRTRAIHRQALLSLAVVTHLSSLHWDRETRRIDESLLSLKTRLEAR
jgi:hypothetical protein